MEGLGKSNEENSIYLAIAGGKVWQKKDANGNAIEDSHPDYATQEYEFSGETKVRSGAMFNHFSGKVTKVEVKQGKFGEQLLVGMDTNSGKYTFSLATNNRNSQNFFAALLVMDFNEPLFIQPYDFEGKDKSTGKPNGKRVVGISFKQGGQKLDLKAIDGVPVAGDELYKSGNTKKIKRFFEDLNDWYVEQVNLKVVPKLIDKTPSSEIDDSDKDNESKTINKSKQVKQESSGGDPTEAEVSSEDLKSQLGSLLGK